MIRAIATLVLLIAAQGVPAATVSGRVVSIADGDTLTVLTADKRQVKIRLAEIDAPERGQPYGNRSRQALSSLVFQKEVSVQVADIDRYGRTVGRVYVGETDVSAEMVRVGAAWVFRRYVTDQSLYALEEEARRAKVGIWGLSETQKQPPWKWRTSGGTNEAPGPTTEMPAATKARA